MLHSVIRIHHILVICLAMFWTVLEGQARTIRIKNNRPLSEQMKEVDVTYIIKSVIDLQGQTIELPANSTLKFRRKGVLQNGYLIGNKTFLSGHPHFFNVRLSGHFNTKTFYASWSNDILSSDFFNDVMNLGLDTKIIVDRDVTLTDSKRTVSHLHLEGKNKTIINADRFSINYGGCIIENLNFCWNKPYVTEPSDNYSAVIIYSSLLQKDTTVNVVLKNINADGGRYCSFFMKQYKSSISPYLRVVNHVENSRFENFTRGAIWTCGGTGRIINSSFLNIGYETSNTLYSVFPLRLGYAFSEGSNSKVVGYEVDNCIFRNTVAAYSSTNDGRELHGLLAYGDSLIIRNNHFTTLSTSFSKETDPGMDAEILYVKGSFNTIQCNSFENGAGSLSDGMITIKIKDTESNVIKDNVLLASANHCRFMQIGGNNHVVERNSFYNNMNYSSETPQIALYLIHYDNTDFVETIQICNNKFVFMPCSTYLCIYANNWGYVSFINNTVVGASLLFKNRGKRANGVIDSNTITMSNVQGKQSDTIIDISEGETNTFSIANNTFDINNSTSGCIVKGKKYSFCHNRIVLEDSRVHSLLRGQDADLVIIDNNIELKGKTTVLKKSIIGEHHSIGYDIRENHVVGDVLNNTLKK